MQEIDLSTFTDDELRSLRLRVLNEQERRQRLLDIPDQVRQLVNDYDHSGGDRAQLVDDITSPSARPLDDLAPAPSDDTINEEKSNQETNENESTNSPSDA